MSDPDEPGSADSRFRTLVESVKDYAIFLLDPAGHIETWNEGARLVKGYEPSEIVGKHFSVFYTAADRDGGLPERLLREAAEKGRVESEGWRVRKDGARFWADVVLTALHDSQGALTGFGKVTRDLTERRSVAEELRRSEERFRLLVEGVQDYAIFMLDPTGHVTTWNEGARRIKGYTQDEILGQHFSRFYPPESNPIEHTRRELEIARREGRFEEEGWRVRNDGSRFWANVVITALRNARGELVGYSKVTRDLTERRRLEDERVQRAQAEEAVRLRDEFLAIAAHELRTPLTALNLGLQTLQKSIGSAEPARSKLLRASRAAMRMKDLIESLLEVSRISTGRFTLALERFDFGTAVTEIVDGMLPAADAARVKIVTQTESMSGVADRVRFAQVLTNLLANAIKYGGGSPVEVRLTRAGGDARVVVRDHGPGIPEKDLERIFGRFERAASFAHYGGLGLGLYVAQEIVLAHGGTIEAENAPDGGAQLTVRLPLLPPTVARSEAT